jgi:putative oxidoreductase
VSTETTERNKTIAWTALRIAAGLTYFSHGAAKLFGWFGAETHVDYMSRFGIAGVIETIGGFLIIVGLFTRIAAFICSGEMAVAYFWMHWGGSGQAWWWENHGEIVMVYSFTWLFFAAWGAGPISLDARRTRGAGGG